MCIIKLGDGSFIERLILCLRWTREPVFMCKTYILTIVVRCRPTQQCTVCLLQRLHMTCPVQAISVTRQFHCWSLHIFTSFQLPNLSSLVHLFTLFKTFLLPAISGLAPLHAISIACQIQHCLNFPHFFYIICNFKWNKKDTSSRKESTRRWMVNWLMVIRI